jgi:phage-related protein
MPAAPILNLDTAWEISQRFTNEVYQTDLGDGYRTSGAGGLHSTKEVWDISRTGLTESERDALVAELKGYAGWRPFRWRSDEGSPYKTFVCEKWEVSEVGEDVWRVSGTFEVEESGECEEYRDLVDEGEVLDQLNESIEWCYRYFRDTFPLAYNSNGVITNNFHPILTGGRSNYFADGTGTTEGMFVTGLACCHAFKQTGNVKFRNLAITVANAALQYMFPKADPFAYTSADYFLAHWLIAVGRPFPFKGKRHPTDYLRDGYFNQPVNFTNGVGVIPATAGIDGNRLSNVYLVHNGKLYFQSVTSPIIPGSGTTFDVDYWVSNIEMLGTRYRLNPNSSSSGGGGLQTTNETAGTIKLTSNFTGQLLVVYAAYTTEIAQKNQRYDAFPMHRPTYPNEFNIAYDSCYWQIEMFQGLADIDPANSAKWQKCIDLTIRDVVRISTIQNLAYWAKKDIGSSDPFAYPGTQIVRVVNGQTTETQYSVSRVQNAGSNLNGFVRINVSSVPQNQYPSIEYQNYASSFSIDEDTTVRAEVASSVDALYELTLSTTSNAFDFSKLFIANWLITGDSQPKTKNFDTDLFVRWGEPNKPYLVWHPTIVDFPNPIYTYQGGGGTATKDRVHQDIEFGGKTLNSVVVWRSVLTKGVGFAGMGYVISEGKQIRKPPRLFFRVQGGDVEFAVIDGSGNKFTTVVEDTNGWVKRSFKWADLESADNEDPDTDNPIQNIQFEIISGSATIYTYWIAEDERKEPEILTAPVRTHKGAIVSRLPDQSYTFWVGDFRPLNSGSDQLELNPGVPAFTANIIGNSIDAYRGGGCPLVGGYTSLYHLLIWGTSEEIENATTALERSQAEYTRRAGFVGPFAPYLIRNYWDSNDFANKYGAGTWIEDGIDPNGGWCGYFARTVEWTARAAYTSPRNTRFRAIAEKSVGFIDRHFLQFNTNRVPTYFSLTGYPSTTYHEPHCCALVMTGAIWLNLLGVSPSVTYRVIYRCYQYITSQYQSTGPMQGSWSKNQPNFVAADGITRQEYFTFWHQEIVNALSTLHEYRDRLILPPCSSSL